MTTDAHKKQKMAHHIVKQGVDEGELTRPSVCELCTFRPKNDLIMAHHWQGYDTPLVVWWICRSCNRMLAGKHDGSLTINEAKNYVLSHKRKKKESNGSGVYMKSRVAEIALSKGVKTVQELSWLTHITTATIYKLWGKDTDLSNVWGNTLRSLAEGLGCKIEDLYIVTEKC